MEVQVLLATPRIRKLIMRKIGAFFKKNWIRFLACLGAGLLVMAGYNFILQFTSDSEAWKELYAYRDGSTIAGFAILFFGLLLLLSHFGAFDIFNFYFQRKKKDDGSKENYGEYVKRKKEEKSALNLYFLPYIITGIIFVLFSVIALLIIK